MTRSFRFVGGAAFLLLATPLFLAACDGSSASSDIDSLLVDARLARQSGDIATAITLLESALTQDSQHPQVRVELGSAYLDREDVNLLDVDRVALFLTTFEATVSSPSETPVQRFGSVCRYEDDPNAHPFDPAEYDEYIDLYANRDLINSVLDLLNGTDPTGVEIGIMPDELRSLSLCHGIEEGELIYDRDGALASLRGFGLSDDEIAMALAVNAVARFMEAYFFITEDIPQQTSWFRVMGSQGGNYIGVCADNQDELRVQVEDAIADLGESITSLDLRDHLLGGDTTSHELVQHVLDAYESVKGDLGPYCNGGA